MPTRGSEDEEMQDISRATYIKNPSDKPLGIELNSFDVEKNAGPQKRDLEVINDIM
jgi:hypothetical protein